MAVPVLLLFGGGLAFASGEPPAPEGPVVEAPGLEQQAAELAAQEAPAAEAPQEAPAAPAPVEPPPYEAVAPGSSGGRTSGYVDLRTQSRWAEDADVEDHDLYGVFGADHETAGPRPWSFHVLLRGSLGLDEQDPDSVFYGVQDTYPDRFDGRVYHAWVQAPVAERLAVSRFGRMVIHETPETAYLDGAQVETQPVGPTHFLVGAYGGLSARQFEDWPSEEWMGGFYTSFLPWVGGRIRLDWMHFDDDVRFGDGQNDLVAGGLTHQLARDLSVEGNYSLLDGDSNDMRLKGQWFWPEQQAAVRLSYYRLLETQANLAYELNPFFNVLNTYFPFDETQLVVSKAFAEVLELQGGLDARRVDDEGDIGRYNRDFDRYYATASLVELLPLKTTLSVTGEKWDGPGNDIDTWGVDLSSRPREDTRLSLGSYYSLYKYYLDVATEREDVRTYYAEIRNTVSESTKVTAKYEYEDDELDTFHSLRLGVTWRF